VTESGASQILPSKLRSFLQVNTERTLAIATIALVLMPYFSISLPVK
jgi:hypothetical protein